MTKVYTAVIHEENGQYWAEFPDIEGCFTDGETMEDVIVNAQEAMGLHLATLLDSGIKLPTARAITEIDADDGIKTFISADPDEYRRDTAAVKKMISLPAWLAKEAEKRDISLSRITQEALKTQLSMA